MMIESAQRLRQLVANLSFGAFIAEVDKAGSNLTLHVRAECDLASARRELIAALRAADIAIDVKILRHKLRRVAAPRSIDHWLKAFASGTVVYDPTLVAQRAQALSRAARACRQEFGKRVTGIYFHPGQRTMYVVIPAMAGIASCAAVTAEQWPFDVRVAAKVPRGELTPVDAASAPLYRQIARMVRRGLAPGAVALAVTSLALPAAANNPQRSASVQGAMSTPAGDATGRYGMLWSLSVFSDGLGLSADRAFATTGLEIFFGDKRKAGPVFLHQIAQTIRPPVIIRDVDANAPSAANSDSPGS